MVTGCEINFDQNPYGTYFAGQMVSGSITLTTDKVKILKGVVLKIKGYARTRWSESTGTGSSKRSTTFYGIEDYIASTTYLLGSEEIQTIQIEPGKHTYTFACTLPPTCPSSFEGQLGHIRYLVRVILYRPWKFDETYTRAFTVLKLMDLNYESPVLRMPAGQETNETFYCGPCMSKPLNIKLMVPQTGFVPGQSIPFTVNITNESNVPVVDVKISLVMFAILFSQHPRVHSRTERTNVAKIKGGAVNTQTTRTITPTIRVPAVPPTCYHLCRILHVTYQIEVEAKLKGMHQNPCIAIPIIIGNVPFVSVIQQQPMRSTYEPHSLEASAPDSEDTQLKDVFTISNGNILPVIDPVQNPADPLSSSELNISPPTYEEALCMTRANCNEEDQHPLGASEFVPRYPVYNIAEMSAPPDDDVCINTDPSKSTWL